MTRFLLTLGSIFILGSCGVLALPQAIANASWFGILMLIICCINTLYADICLGKCWTILEERYDEYKENNKHPYAEIAYRASGNPMRYVVSFCNKFTLFGVATIFLMLASQLIGSLVSEWEISFHYWVLILAAILCPLMWLETSNDPRLSSIFILIVTIIAWILLMSALVIAVNLINPKIAVYDGPSVMEFFLAFGTIMFAFGGASSFPIFHSDRNDRKKFPSAVITGFLALMVLYLLVSVLGYLIFGNGLDEKHMRQRLQSNIIMTLPDTVLRSVLEVLLSLYFIYVFLIIVKTASQDFEEFFNIPKCFGWKRCLLRTGMLLLMVIVAEILPRFDKILNVVGGSSVTLSASVLPCYFYLRLCNMSSNDPEWPQRRISRPEKILLYISMNFGIIGGSIATFFAVKAIVGPNAFDTPCY